MADCNELADFQWLIGVEAAELAAELTTNAVPLHTAVGRLRDRLSPVRTHLLLELIESRRRAAAKFTAADRMFFTPLGLEQATDEWVAAYKAERLADQGPVTDLCCGIGGDLLALAQHSPVIGVDLNPTMAHLAAANAQAVLPPEITKNVSFHIGDVESFDLHNVSAWHIDPDRRPTGRRTTSLDWSSPNLATLERMLAAAPNAAIKLAPAAEVPAEWVDRCELEWISRDRECRQLIAWYGGLAQSPGQHRATVLSNATRNLEPIPEPSGTVPIFPRPLGNTSRGKMGLSPSPRPFWDRPSAPRTITGTPNERLIIAPKIDRYVFDPDPAIMAARLKGALAAEHNLSAITAGPTYLTGPQPITDAALACFEVLDVLPLRTRSLSDYLREHNIGRLEIKTRGVEIDPQRLRHDLKLRGEESATLLLTAIGRRQLAIIARRV